MQQSLEITLLGHFQLHYNGEVLRTIDTPRAQLLLAWLLLNRDAPQPRQQIAYQFWPDSSEKQARTNLRKVLHQLRQGLPQADQFLRIDNQTIGWCDHALLTLDVADFAAQLAAAAAAAENGQLAEQRQALSNAVALYQGDLLTSHYDDWLLAARERLRMQWVTAIHQLIALTEAQGDYRQAITYAQRLLHHDPLHEATYRHLMRLHQATGDRAAMLHIYHNCKTVLQRELAVQPAPATEELYAQLLQKQVQTNLPAPVRRVDRDGPQQTTVQTTSTATTTFPLIGRTPHWQQLQTVWREASMGKPTLLLITGEPGIGKTRLTEELVLWASRQGVMPAMSHAYATEQTLAYAPVIRWLRVDAIQQTLDELPVPWLTELLRLLPELTARFPDVSLPTPLREPWQRTRLLDALAQALLAKPGPLLLVLEDLNWADRETITWLPTLLRLEPNRPILVVGTVRLEEIDEEHELSLLRHTLQREGLLIELPLQPLTCQATTALAEAVSGQPLAPPHAAQIYEETEGNPLFIVEMMRAARECADPSADALMESTPAIDSATLPPKVEAVLQARLRQLTPATREVVALAAVIGRDFTFELLAAVSEQDEDALIRALDEAWQRQIIREQGGDAYDFSHEKIRFVVYRDLSQLQRRRYHRRVAAALEAQTKEAQTNVSSPQHYDRLAHHHAQAGDLWAACQAYCEAAQRAYAIFAMSEALDTLHTALQLLTTLMGKPTSSPEMVAPERGAPEIITSEMVALEAELQLMLGTAYATVQGYGVPQAGAAFAQALRASQRAGNEEQRTVIRFGLWLFHLIRGNYAESNDVAHAILTQATAAEADDLLALANCALGITLLHQAKGRSALHYLNACVDFYGTEHAADAIHTQQPLLVLVNPHFSSRSYRMIALWLLGYPEQALHAIEETVAIVTDSGSPLAQAQVLNAVVAVLFHQRDHARVLHYTEQVLALCQQYELEYWRTFSALFQLWAQLGLGIVTDKTAAGAQVATIHQTVTTLIDRGARSGVYLLLMVIADGYQSLGRHVDALAALEEAEAVTDEIGEPTYLGEIWRMRGKCLAQLALEDDDAKADEANQDDPEIWYQRALEHAQRHELQLFALRAAVSIAQRWTRQDKLNAAQELMAPIYGWFTEGFDSHDLQAARALLSLNNDNGARTLTLP